MIKLEPLVVMISDKVCIQHFKFDYNPLYPYADQE